MIKGIASSASSAPVVNVSGESAGAQALWDIVRRNDEISEYEEFIEKFPNSSLKVAAEYRIEELKNKARKIEQFRFKKEREREMGVVSKIQEKRKSAKCLGRGDA